MTEVKKVEDEEKARRVAEEKKKAEEESARKEAERLAAIRKNATSKPSSTISSSGSCTKNEYYIITNVTTNTEYVKMGDPDCKTGTTVKTLRVATGAHENFWNPSGWWYYGATPAGKWKIISKEPKSASSIYGPYFLRMRYLAGGYVDSYALHGTNEADSIGKWASHGCIRHYNSDIIYLNSILKVGTVVWTVK